MIGLGLRLAVGSRAARTRLVLVAIGVALGTVFLLGALGYMHARGVVDHRVATRTPQLTAGPIDRPGNSVVGGAGQLLAGRHRLHPDSHRAWTRPSTGAAGRSPNARSGHRIRVAGGSGEDGGEHRRRRRLARAGAVACGRHPRPSGAARSQRAGGDGRLPPRSAEPQVNRRLPRLQLDSARPGCPRTEPAHLPADPVCDGNRALPHTDRDLHRKRRPDRPAPARRAGIGATTAGRKHAPARVSGSMRDRHRGVHRRRHRRRA